NAELVTLDQSHHTGRTCRSHCCWPTNPVFRGSFLTMISLERVEQTWLHGRFAQPFPAFSSRGGLGKQSSEMDSDAKKDSGRRRREGYALAGDDCHAAQWLHCH